jgi:hypothetical protein
VFHPGSVFGLVKIEKSINFKQSSNAMKYKVHKLDVSRDTMQEQLENYLNRLNGEVISVLPNVKPTFLPMGATAKVDFLLIVERIR